MREQQATGFTSLFTTLAASRAEEKQISRSQISLLLQTDPKPPQAITVILLLTAGAYQPLHLPPDAPLHLCSSVQTCFILKGMYLKKIHQLQTESPVTT